MTTPAKLPTKDYEALHQFLADRIAELGRLLDGLPDDPTPAAYDEDQALGRLAMTSEALRLALDSREAGSADSVAGHDGELHHLARRVLESVTVVLTQREPSIARPADTAQPEES